MSKSPTKSKKNLSNEQDTPKIKNTEPVSPSHDAKVDPEPQHAQVDNEQQQIEEAMGVVERFENNPQPQLEDEEENREVPSDKDQLIEYLKETLKRAEMTMGTVFVAIEIEKEKRTKLVDEINEKKSEIDEINAEENNFLSEKVNEKMATALQRALEDKDIAESEHAESQQKVDELESRIKELDENVQSVHLEKAQREAGILDTQYKVNEQDSMIDSYNVELEKLSNKNKERANKINNLTTEIDDMKSIIESLSNARIKLNHYLKDETPTQSRQGARNARTPQGVRPDVRNSGERYVSGEDAQLFELTTTPTKPNAPPADDDFWYSEAKNKFRGSEQQQRRVESQEPWQPKVQYYELPAKTPEYNQGNTVKLPNINNGRPEYLYKSKEYNDEFANTNQRTVKKGQVQAQQQKRRF